MKMNEWLFFSFLLIPTFTQAEDQMWGKIAEACRQDTTLRVCTELSENIKKAERRVNKLLEKHGIKDATMVTGTVAKLLIDQRLKIKTGKIGIINVNRSVIEAGDKEVFLKLEWDFK